MRMTRVRDERGSLPMALLVTIALLSVSGVMTTSVIQGQRSTGFDQQYEAAVTRAESGVDRLAHLVRTDQSVLASVSGTDYTATSTPISGGWLLTGTGTSGGVQRTVELRMTKQTLWAYGVFADESIKMVGSPPSVKSYDEWVWDTGQGSIASNGPIHETHADTWDLKYEYLTPPLILDSDAAVQFILDACEGLAQTPLTLTGTMELTAGDYCVSDLVVDSDAVITVDGQVRLYVFGSTSIGADATINCAVNCTAGAAGKPVASNFQILTANESGIIFGKGLRMAGAVFAPRAECTSMPFVRIFGALTCREAQLQRAFFQLHFDERLRDLGGGWNEQWKES